MSEPKPILAVCFGVDEAALQLLKATLNNIDIREYPLDIKAMLKPRIDFEPDMIFCGRFDKITLIEMAQGVRAMYSTQPIYLVTSERHGFDRRAAAKCGFTDAFLMPMDQAILRDLVAEGSVDFKDVSLIDLTPDTVLDFDTYVFLPMNRKYIRFSSAGHPLSQERVQRLIKHHVSTVQVAREDLQKFYDFTAAQLKKLAQNDAGSESEKRERLRIAVRNLFTGFLTDVGEIENCTEIVKSYLLNSSDATASLYQKVMRLGGSGQNGFTHVSNASTMAAMFAVALMPESAEDIAVAGLLHDIGMAEIPLAVQFKPDAERSDDERQLYQRHPQRALELLKKRGVTLPERVVQIIEQHHERFDGSGFPKKSKEKEISREAQLFAFCDEFDYLTTVEIGKARPTPQVVLDTLLQSPSYDPDLRNEIAGLLKS
jgi:putative nucleotidyltransferase with HDIG domain